MERCCGFVVLVIFVFILHLVQAEDEKGFINLDCGLSPKESPYKDSTLELTYTSDDGYVRGGKTSQIEKEHTLAFFESSLKLRYFPEGIRNCYNLNVTRGMNYLIRAIFVYGNYDGLNVVPNFDLYLGPNKWATVKDVLSFEELIHVPRSNSLQVCLVKTGKTTPMINSLELRPLRNNMYTTERGSFRNMIRYYFSTTGGLIMRHPEDVHDRMWLNNFKDEWALINTALSINTSTGYDIPQDVMANAITPKKASSTMLNFSWESGDPSAEIYLYMHFAELQPQTGDDQRQFFIFLNGEIINGPYIPTHLKVKTIYDTTPRKCKEGKCLLQLNGMGGPIPPMINAMEIYTLINHSQLETNEDDVFAIKNIQSTYRLSKISWEGDPCVPSQFLWDGLKCNSFDNSTPPIVTFLNLSSSALTGIITPSILNLTHLQELDLSNNNLTGGVPEFLADMKSLLVINLSRNNLNGPVPKKLIQKKGLKLNVEGNPNIFCTTGSCVNGSKEGGHRKNNIILSISASLALVVVLVVVPILFCVLIKKKKPSTDEEPTSCMLNTGGRSSRSSEPTIMSKNKRFTYSEVVKMTKNFQRVLGKGGFGIVYYGSVNDTEEVAIKMLSHSSSQGYKQFKAEVELLLRVHHKNLVGLVGYCDEGENLALIYEYMANGDLDEHMSGKRGGSFLNWAARLKIVADSAQGLEYLHNGCKPLMVHRDIKTTNILLNEHFQAKLADFGLSRSFPIEGETHVSTVVAGTIGYLDPEYYRTNWLTEKSDVYSFGIVILEIVTNQPVIDQNREKRHIAEWVGKMLTKGDIKSITDPSLHGDYDSGSVWKAVELAMSCLNPSSVNRPTMTQVVFELNECLASENLRGGHSPEMNSQSSIEVSMTFDTEANPTAR
ncbi:PREDICTED: probable LRR receptor-like serine/threonine-protein kinase At1g51810 [Camelina sativa]|uniref:Probable LRR receptor-like serine/threonine-protein kinase At1g51810 n=1 Tax=Camelina sativa TaxID=90675 RepID=A0ABM0YH29_CAMSA|nr:PREDICTED: probable LRR receptor-like serine/threonine-protein kinase At1g51810 [Camelina sativa]